MYSPLPPAVMEALDAIEDCTRYFFRTGESKPKSGVGDWQRSLRRLFKLAAVHDGHALRFRDTFAVELLLAGVPLERASMLLAHQSVKVTQKHYTPWVLARQEQLEQDVRRTWDLELVASTPTDILETVINGAMTRGPHMLSRSEWVELMAIPVICESWGLAEDETPENFAAHVYAPKFHFHSGSPGYVGDLYILQGDVLTGEAPIVLTRGRDGKLEIMEGEDR